MNPMQIIQLIKQGQNPQQLVLMMLQQQANTPLGANLLSLAQQGKTAEIEPLVNELEPRSRRARKAKQQEDARAQIASTSSSNGSGIGADHPILKRKRVQRDLSQVIFGPTQ